MPLHKSYVFASNRGGIGKSTLTFNWASKYAEMHPELQVLVIDLSVQADSSALLLGGTQVPEVHTHGAHTLGMQRIVTSATQKRASGLIQAVLDGATQPGFIGRMSGRGGPAAGPLDPREHSLNVREFHPASGQPANLWVAPGGKDLLETITEENWRDVVRLLKAAMAASAGGAWTVFFDSDAEVRERAASRVAVAAAERMILPLSSSWNDYSRMLGDPVNGIFDLLQQLEAAGAPFAKIDRVCFNRIIKDKNAPVALHEDSLPSDATLSFSPVKAVREQLASMSDALFEAGWNVNSEMLSRFYSSEGLPPGEMDAGKFSERFIVSLFEVPEMPMAASALSGTPLCNLSASTTYLKGSGTSAAGIKIGKDVLEKLQTDIADAVQGL